MNALNVDNVITRDIGIAPKIPDMCFIWRGEIGRWYGITNEAAIAIQCKSNVKLNSCLVL